MSREPWMAMHFKCCKCGKEDSLDIDGLYPEQWFKEDLAKLDWLHITDDEIYCPDCKHLYEETEEVITTTNKVEINQPIQSEIKLNWWNRLGLGILKIQRRFQNG